ncbi:MAG: hypothetical protein PHR79_10690, partial [Bacteroidales bacterium]|nr:hypothetical protein [Bacteroidales bacterium]
TKYQIKKDVSNLFTKTLTGVISGLYILEPFTNMNWNIIIWRVFFFALWLIFGYFRYVGDFNFTSKEYRKQVISKTNHIIKFRNSLNNHPDWYEDPIIDDKEENIKIIDENEETKEFQDDKPFNVFGNLAFKDH